MAIRVLPEYMNLVPVEKEEPEEVVKAIKAGKPVTDLEVTTQGQITEAVLLHVAGELDPGIRVYRRLRPIIRDEIKRLRKERTDDIEYLASNKLRRELKAYHRQKRVELEKLWKEGQK